MFSADPEEPFRACACLHSSPPMSGSQLKQSITPGQPILADSVASHRAKFGELRTRGSGVEAELTK